MPKDIEMIKELFPRGHQLYLLLPLLGSMLNKFAKFLNKLGYSHRMICYRMWAIPAIDHSLRQFGCYSIKNITKKKLLACSPARGHAKDNANASATVKLLEKFFYEEKIFHAAKLSLIEQKIFEYSSYLKHTRGLAQSTIKIHCLTISQFLFFLKKQHKFPKLEKLTSTDIEKFLCETGNRVGRGFLQHIVAHLRSFLRFITFFNDKIQPGLGDQIDTPRTYREEKLPRSVPWNIVQKLLQSVDRTKAIGKRDYAILLLITTYGLRASEVISLKLDDIDWRANLLKIFQRKTKNLTEFPLTTTVGKAIIDYLKNGRPNVRFREIFISHKSPNNVFKAPSINNIFRHWIGDNSSSIPIKNAHSLRHSYAIYLLRQGTSLKTIGDILGHKSFESTCVYLRLNLEDLREVPLSFPTSLTHAEKENYE
jgi:integrase/recombinase XerD